MPLYATVGLLLEALEAACKAQLTLPERTEYGVLLLAPAAVQAYSVYSCWHPGGDLPAPSIWLLWGAAGRG